MKLKTKNHRLKTIKAIKEAVDEGLIVKCDSDSHIYDVIKSKHTGDYLIICADNDCHKDGLHGLEGTNYKYIQNLNGTKFYTIEIY